MISQIKLTVGGTIIARLVSSFSSFDSTKQETTESKPVKLETSCAVILPLNWVFSGLVQDLRYPQRYKEKIEENLAFEKFVQKLKTYRPTHGWWWTKNGLNENTERVRERPCVKCVIKRGYDREDIELYTKSSHLPARSPPNVVQIWVDSKAFFLNLLT